MTRPTPTSPTPTRPTPESDQSVTPAMLTPANSIPDHSTPGPTSAGATRRRVLQVLTGVAVSVAAAACSAPTTTQNGTDPATEPASANGTAGATGTGFDRLGHVHAVAFTAPAAAAAPGTPAEAPGLLLATHTGLFALPLADADPTHAPTSTSPEPTPAPSARRLTQVGEPIDLMGFTAAGDGTYLASGHPSPGSRLPQPLGLAASTDHGRTWQVVSRGGQSDFHTLAVSRRGVIAFDGTLRFSPDRRSWQDRTIPAPPRVLSANWDTGQVLATTEQGLLSSADDGRTWTALQPPALLSDVTWIGQDTVVGITTAQVLALSRDRGRTWRSGPGPVTPPAGVPTLGPVAALTAREAAPGQPPEVVIVFDTLPVRTHDLGATTALL